MLTWITVVGVLVAMVLHQISRNSVCGNCCAEYRGCEGERQYRTLISLLGFVIGVEFNVRLLLTTRRIGEMRVRNHCSPSHPANNSLQERYKMEELLERSPTLPRTNQTTASNDGNSPEKLTVNSALGFEKQSDLTKRRRTAYVIKSASSWSPKTIGWFLSSEILPKAGTSRDI
ncbi:protein ATSYTF [Dorcoceras hygrometricum]|uniref:Protein ATSYTF n=1 Tax=Dorcoceras hygrometricum TaxID=472368 RepID=A0A2Z7B7N8_9LAMI|nr:protein ATSYTF [Dorcoceras hygrometricum]